ncbi:MAG: CoA-binding protein [Chloroflexota bacterium]|nr:CoA-binding protein [Chloroflexota bacterium]
MKESSPQSSGIYQRGQALEYIFHPRSIALVGISSDPNSLIGQGFLRGLIDFGYQGDIYPINPKAKEIGGLRAYPSILDVPGPVDHTISMIPAPMTLKLAEECGAKGVKVLHLFTAGFSETGDEEGKRMEAELLATTRRVGIRLLGPNCMGIHYARNRITFDQGVDEKARESGGVSFLSQSGGNAVGLIQRGPFRGVRFNKVVSYGNALDLDETDILEHFIADPATELIAAYIEGIKDGPRFRDALMEATRTKPVIVLKGGRTAAGAGAVSSHTGALAGSDEIWDALLRQAGAVRVYSMDELMDMLVAFCNVPLPRGRSAGIIGVGGGASVEAADLCESVGIKVPALPAEIRKKLREFTPEAGTSVRNPVDTISMFNPPELGRTLELVAGWEGIDFIIFQQELGISFLHGPGKIVLDMGLDALIAAAKGLGKPVVLVLRAGGRAQGISILAETQERCLRGGLPIFPSIREAALAMSRYISYHEERDSG